MEPVFIFQAAGIVKSIASYLGLIESVQADVKKLLHQSFKSAVQNLKYAKDCSNGEALDYLKEARCKFIDAVSVEENENLVSSYWGLAMCQSLLGDEVNACKTMDKICKVLLTTAERNRAIALDISGLGGDDNDTLNPLNPLLDMAWRGVRRSFGRKGPNELRREQGLEEYKNFALKCFQELDLITKKLDK